MSYDRYREYICKRGHYANSIASVLAICPICGEPMEFVHDVDETNGYYPNDPSTLPAPTIDLPEDPRDDVHKVDKYGSQYVEGLRRFAPAPGSAWTRIHDE